MFILFYVKSSRGKKSLKGTGKHSIYCYSALAEQRFQKLIYIPIIFTWYQRRTGFTRACSYYSPLLLIYNLPSVDSNVPDTIISKSLWWPALQNIQVEKYDQVHKPAPPTKILPDVCVICRKRFQMLLQNLSQLIISILG